MPATLQIPALHRQHHLLGQAEGDLNLGLPLGCWRDASDVKLPHKPVVFRLWPLPIQDVDARLQQGGSFAWHSLLLGLWAVPTSWNGLPWQHTACRTAYTQVHNLMHVQSGPQHASVAVQSICVVFAVFA